MRKAVSFALAMAGLIAVSGNASLAQTTDNDAKTAEIGRYQLVAVSQFQVFVIDTATGQCWSRTGGEEWRDEGNPAKKSAKKRKGENADVRLDLPSESVDLTIVQREERAIPGSDGSVKIRLGDITDGQALLSIGTTNDEFLVEKKSVAQGDSVRFSLGDKKYVLRVRELRNVLLGDDFAIVEVTEVNQKDSPEKEESPRKSPEK